MEFKKNFIIYGRDLKNPEGRFGVEVYLIRADNIEDAIDLCPLPREEIIASQIYLRKTSSVEKVFEYYE